MTFHRCRCPPGTPRCAHGGAGPSQAAIRSFPPSLRHTWSAGTPGHIAGDEFRFGSEKLFIQIDVSLKCSAFPGSPCPDVLADKSVICPASGRRCSSLPPRRRGLLSVSGSLIGYGRYRAPAVRSGASPVPRSSRCHRNGSRCPGRGRGNNSAMFPSRFSASSLSLAIGSSLRLPLVITKGRPVSCKSRWCRGVYGSITPRYFSPGATARRLRSLPATAQGRWDCPATAAVLLLHRKSGNAAGFPRWNRASPRRAWPVAFSAPAACSPRPRSLRRRPAGIPPGLSTRLSCLPE